MMTTDVMISFIVFIALFIVFVALGFYGAYWRKGDLSTMHEWALAGKNLGTVLVWFLVGADLYTAYTFVAVPSGVFAKGAIIFFAVPYVGLTFGVAMIVMPSLWKIAHEKKYITAADFAKDKFKSPTVGILVAITGIIALLPYIALQIVGMQAILGTMLIDAGLNTKTLYFGFTIIDWSLIISFIILAAFVFTSGLRGATLTAVMKDAIIFTTVVVVIVAVLMKYSASSAFASTPKNYATLPSSLGNAYISLAVISALALYLYPHAVNGALSAESPKKLRMSTALLPIYGIGLALLALFGILVYAVPSAMSFLTTQFPDASQRGIYVVPALIQATTPSWFVGFAFLGIFIGGLVPAAIMAMAQANLLTRNIVLEFKPDLTDQQQTVIAKWSSALFKFLALGFVFFVPATYAIQLQLLGGVLIVQTLPPVFIALYTKWLNKYAIIAGWVAGIGSGLVMLYWGNIAVEGGVFKTFTTSFMNTQPFGLLYVGLTSLLINLVVVAILTFAFNAVGTGTTTPAQGD